MSRPSLRLAADTCRAEPQAHTRHRAGLQMPTSYQLTAPPRASLRGGCSWYDVSLSRSGASSMAPCVGGGAVVTVTSIGGDTSYRARHSSGGGHPSRSSRPSVGNRIHGGNEDNSSAQPAPAASPDVDSVLLTRRRHAAHRASPPTTAANQERGQNGPSRNGGISAAVQTGQNARSSASAARGGQR